MGRGALQIRAGNWKYVGRDSLKSIRKALYGGRETAYWGSEPPSEDCCHGHTALKTTGWLRVGMHSFSKSEEIVPFSLLNTLMQSK